MRYKVHVRLAPVTPHYLDHGDADWALSEAESREVVHVIHSYDYILNREPRIVLEASSSHEATAKAFDVLTLSSRYGFSVHDFYIGKLD